MKKILIIFAVLILTIFIAPFSFAVSAAEDSIDINTYYPYYPTQEDNDEENNVTKQILEYSDLTDISNISTNDDYFAYATNDTINILNKKTKVLNQINTISNVIKIKFCYNYLIIAGNNTINILDTNTLNINQINAISYSSDAKINFFINETDFYIGIINFNQTENEFYLDIHSFNINDNEIILNSHNDDIHIKLHSSQHTPYALTLNNNKCYILSKNIEDDPTKSILCIIDIVNKSTSEDTFFKNTSLIEIFKFENRDYFATFNQTSLSILDTNYNKVIEIVEGDNPNSPFIIRNVIDNTTIDCSFPINSIADIEIRNNKLFICDDYYRTICELIMSHDDNNLHIISNKVLISSNSSDIGRFDNASNPYFLNNNIYVADTDNDRIQIFNNSTQIIPFSTNTKPNNLVVDKFENMYYISTENKNTLNKTYFYENNYKTITTNKFSSSNLGKILQLQIDNNNSLYLLDQTNHCIHTFTTDLEYIRSLPLPAVDNNAKLEFIKDLNKLVLYNGDSLYLVDITDFSKSTKITLNNCIDITSGLSSIYALVNNNIKVFKITNNQFEEIETISNDNFSNYNSIALDIINNHIYGFNIIRQCLEFININPVVALPNNKDILESTPLKESTQPIPLKSKTNSVIYEYPYNLGKCFHFNSEINCIGISKTIDNNYYKVLISIDDKLTPAYITISETTQFPIEEDEVSVIVTNPQIPIYKYPTLLEYNSKRLTIDTLDRNTIITLNSHFPISIDNENFYLYIDGETYGYIFSADVVINTGNAITYLHNENAKISTFNNEKASVYAKDLETIITTLDNDYRIYVEKYDKNSKWTKIIFKNSDSKEIEGYILTEHIDMDNYDTSQIILIIIIAVSILILSGIIISYIVIKKKK